MRDGRQDEHRLPRRLAAVRLDGDDRQRESVLTSTTTRCWTFLRALRRYHFSLGDALRPGLHGRQQSDAGQISRADRAGQRLTQRAWAKDVQVMVEGPGHMAMNEIAANMQHGKAPLPRTRLSMSSGRSSPISAPGYDHITSAIGGAIAAAGGRGLPVLRYPGGAPAPAG